MKLVFYLTALNFLQLLIRRPWGILTPTMYYEDGQTFLSEQIITDSARMLITPFFHGALNDSYLLFLTRLITFISCLFPSGYIPYILNISGMLVVSLSSSLFAHSIFRSLIQSDLLRSGFSILITISLDGGEFLGTTTNCFWTLSLTLCLLVINPDDIDLDCKKPIKQTLKNLGLFTLGFLSAISTPVSGILVPIVCCRLFLFESKRIRAFFIGLVIGGILQIFTNQFYSIGPVVSNMFYSWNKLISFLNITTYHIIVPTFLGYNISQILLTQKTGHWISIAACTVLLLLYLRVGLKDKKFLLFGFFIAVFAIILFIIPVIKRDLWKSQFYLDQRFIWEGKRYYFATRALFSLLAFLLADRLIKNKLVAIGILCVIFGFGIINNFTLKEPKPTIELSWANYTPMIDLWKEQSMISEGKEVIIPIYIPSAWRILLPADLNNKNYKWHGQVINSQNQNDIIQLDKKYWLSSLTLLDNNNLNLYFSGTFTHLCDNPRLSNIVIKIRDSFGNHIIETIRLDFCGEKKNFNLMLAAERRRGLYIEIKYTGNRKVYLSDFSINADSS